MLPKTEHPTFPKTLPLSGKVVHIRPMTIKDEKILMMVGDTNTDRLDSIKQVLSNCVVGDIDLDKMAFIDFQYLFIMLRATSIDGTVQLFVSHENKEYPVEINLLEVKFRNIDEFKKKSVVKFGETAGIVFKSPTFRDIYNAPHNTDLAEDATAIIVRSIDSVFFGDDVYDSTSLSEQEMTELFDSLPSLIMKDVNVFFSSLPVMYYEGKIKLEDGTEKNIEVTDFSDFF